MEKFSFGEQVNRKFLKKIGLFSGEDAFLVYGKNSFILKKNIGRYGESGSLSRAGLRR